MKKIRIFSTIFTMLIQVSFAYTQIPNLIWANSMGGVGSEAGFSIALDDSGNVYTAGYYSNTVDFDPGPGIFNQTSNGLTDIFITKIDAGGNFVWVKCMGGAGDDYVYSLSVDQAGNVIATGFFNGTVDFDPNMGVNNLSSNGNREIYIEKLDRNGNFIWAKSIGGAGYDDGNAITTDLACNIYLTGSFEGTVDFDPGIGIFNLIDSTSRSIFVEKIDSSGNFVFAKAFTGTGVGFGISIQCDNQGNLYTAGQFGGIMDFDPGAGVFNLSSQSPMSPDSYVQKSDINGNFIWAKLIGGTNGVHAYSIVTDPTGNAFTIGAFYDTADFDPGPGIFNLTSNGNRDVFIQKLDASGNFVWAKNIGGKGEEDVNNCALDIFGNIYLPGYFADTVDFNPGTGVNNLISHGFRDIYILKLNNAGSYVWSAGIGGSNYAGSGWSIATNAYGEVYTTGYFSDTCDFDPNNGVSNISSSGQTDVFLIKLDQGISGIEQIKNEIKMDLFPNPTLGEFSIKVNNENVYIVEILSITGQVIKKEKFSGTNSISMVLEEKSGLYFVKIVDAEGNQTWIKVCKL